MTSPTLLAASTADPRVMATLSADGATLPPKSISRVPRSRRRPLATVGFGLWIFRDGAGNAFVGYGGIKHAEVDGGAEIELAYAITSDHSRKGSATEISLAALKHAFDVLGLAGSSLASPPHAHARRNKTLPLTYTHDIVHANLPHVLYILDARLHPKNLLTGANTASFLNSGMQGLALPEEA